MHLAPEKSSPDSSVSACVVRFEFVAAGLQQRLYKYHLFFEGHYVAFRNARPVTFNADGAPPVEGTDDLMDAFSRGFRDILPSFGPALRVWPFLPRHGELFKFSQSIRWLESDWLICFLPMVVQRSFLVTNFLTPKARTRIAQLGEDMGVRGSVSRVAHGYEGDSALQIQAISLKPEVLQEFADAFVGLGGEGTQVADRREAVSDFMELYKIPPVSIILGSAFVTCSAEDRPEPSMPGLPTHSPIPGMGTK